MRLELLIRTVCYGLMIFVLLYHGANKWYQKRSDVAIIHLSAAIFFVCLTYFAISRDERIVTYFMTPFLAITTVLSVVHVLSRLGKRD